MRYLKSTITDFIADDAQTMAAAIAYFTLFALPPLLLVVISIAGLAFGRQHAQEEIQSQIESVVGQGAAQQISTIIASAGQRTSSGIVAGILGIISLIFGATSAFAQLQTSLNAIWRLKPDPKAGEARTFILRRLFSFGMVVALGFLLVISLIVDAVLAGLGKEISRYLPAGLSTAMLQAMGFVVSFLVVAALFGAMFKVLPDARIEWRQVVAGAIFTAFLFTIGKFLIGFYIGKTGAASAYGAAGSLVLIVLWLYYSSMIVLLGAEFTRVWAESHGPRVEPKEGVTRARRSESGAAGWQQQPSQT